MRLDEAQTIIRQTSGKSYSWMRQYGLSWIREAIRTIQDRKSATETDHEYADAAADKIARKW